MGKKKASAPKEKKSGKTRTVYVTAPRRHKKTYRMKKPKTMITNAIGKFEHKHPYISAVGVAILGGATIDGLSQNLPGNRAISRRMGMADTVQKIPFWESVRKGVNGLVQDTRTMMNNGGKK